MKKMNINYTMFDTVLTGGVRVLLEIANHLVDRGHHVTITSFGDEKMSGWFDMKADANFMPPTRQSRIKILTDYTLSRLHKRNSQNRFNPFPYDGIKALADIIPDCDINVATYCFTAFSVFESAVGKPFYHMQHYEPLFFKDSHLARIAEESYYLPLQKIVNSIWLRNQMQEKYGCDLPIVNPAVDHSVFYPRNVKRTSDELTVMCFAKEARWKGFPEALEAMRHILNEKMKVKLVAFGLEKPHYQSSVPYDFIRAPSDDQLATLYSSADVVICPSWYESFPLYPLEAMACGTPIVTTPYGTEDYTINEKNCLVVSPKDPVSLANATMKLLKNEQLREDFRKEGIETARQFTWDKTTDAVERLFSQSLSKE
jgi:glycosyltransferase involved in cell wall biosynthesis